MAKYRAKQGQEDRNGEMVGAITFNMILALLPIQLWSIIAPNYLSVTTTLIVGLTAAIALPLLGLPVSRHLWAIFSEWADKEK